MPLEYSHFFLYMAHDWIAGSHRRGSNGIPADFPVRSVLYPRTQNVCEQLAAEADPEDGHVALECLLYAAHFGVQMGMAAAVVDIHGSTEYDQCVVAIDGWRRFRIAREIDKAYAVAAASNQGVERAQGLRGNMLENQYSGHGSKADKVAQALQSRFLLENATVCIAQSVG